MELKFRSIQKPYMHILQSLGLQPLHIHRTKVFSNTFSVVHHKHLIKKMTKASKKINLCKQNKTRKSKQIYVNSKVYVDDKLISLPFSIQSINLRDSISIGINFLIFISIEKIIRKFYPPIFRLSTKLKRSDKRTINNLT